MKKECEALVVSLVCAATCLAAEINLGGTWTLVQADDQSVTCPAKVPGDVHSALFSARIIPDPHFGRNELKNLWVGEREWIFSRTFDVPEEFLKAKRVTLRLEDVDTFCTVSVNGVELGRTENRFRRWDYDVTKLLRPGRNEIRGKFDDNSFTLLPGEAKILTFRPKDADATAEDFRKAFSVTHLRETYR